MATKLFLTGLVSGTPTRQYWQGDVVLNPPSISFPIANGLADVNASAVGSTFATVNTATGPQILQFGRFSTPPLTANVTISGTISINLWGLESSMSANAGFRVDIYRLQPNGTVTSIATKTNTVELGTASSVNAFTVTPTSTNFLVGDCIGIAVSATDVGGTMGAGFTASLKYDGTTGGADGDSWVSFTEALSFTITFPSNALYPTNNTSDLGSPYLEWQIGGSIPSAFNINTTTSAGPKAYPGVVLNNVANTSWITPQLQAITLTGGIFELDLDFLASAAGVHASFTAQLYKTDSTDSTRTLLGTLSGNGNRTGGAGEITQVSADNPIAYYMPINTVTLANGDRLKLQLFFDDAMPISSTVPFGDLSNTGGSQGIGTVTAQMGNATFCLDALTVYVATTPYAPQVPTPGKRWFSFRRALAKVVPMEIVSSRPVLWSLRSAPINKYKPTRPRPTARVVPMEIPSSRPVLWSLQVRQPQQKILRPIVRTRAINPPLLVVPPAPPAIFAPALQRRKPTLAKVRTRAITPNLNMVAPLAPQLQHPKPRMVFRKSLAFVPPIDDPTSRPVLWALLLPKVNKAWISHRKALAFVPPQEIPSSRPVLWALQLLHRRDLTRVVRREPFVPSFDIQVVTTQTIFAPTLTRRLPTTPRIRSRVVAPPVDFAPFVVEQLPKKLPVLAKRRAQVIQTTLDIPSSRPVLWALQVNRKPVTTPRIRSRVAPIGADTFTLQGSIGIVRERIYRGVQARKNASLGFNVVQATTPVAFVPTLPTRKTTPVRVRTRAINLPIDDPTSRPVLWSLQLPTRKLPRQIQRQKSYNLPVDIPASRPVLWALQLPKVNRVVTPKRKSLAIKADIYIVTIPPPQGQFVPYLPKVNRVKFKVATRKTSFGLDIPSSRPVLWALQLPKVNRFKPVVAKSKSVQFALPELVLPTLLRVDRFKPVVVRSKAVQPGFQTTPPVVIFVPTPPKLVKIRLVIIKSHAIQPSFVVTTPSTVVFVPTLSRRARLTIITSKRRTSFSIDSRLLSLWTPSPKTRVAQFRPLAKRSGGATQAPLQRIHSPQVNRIRPTRPYRRFRTHVEFVSGVAFLPPPAGLNMTGQPLLLIRADPYRMVEAINRELVKADAYRRVKGVNRTVDRADGPRRVRRKHV